MTRALSWEFKLHYHSRSAYPLDDVVLTQQIQIGGNRSAYSLSLGKSIRHHNHILLPAHQPEYDILKAERAAVVASERQPRKTNKTPMQSRRMQCRCPSRRCLPKTWANLQPRRMYQQSPEGWSLLESWGKGGGNCKNMQL